MFKVADNLYRGPRPYDMAQIEDNKINIVIDLQSGAWEYFHEDQYEKDKNKIGCNVTLLDYDLSVIFPPKQDLVHHILERMSITIRENYKIYIHCRKGQDRTGYIIAAFRMHCQGWSFRAAVDEMYSMGFNRLRYFWWVPFLRKYER